jgi:hypothetical protein
MAAVRFRFADDVHHVCEIIGKTCNAMAACRGNAKLSRVGFAWRRDWNRAVSRHPDQMPMPPPRDAALLGRGARLVIGSLANRQSSRNGAASFHARRWCNEGAAVGRSRSGSILIRQTGGRSVLAFDVVGTISMRGHLYSNVLQFGRETSKKLKRSRSAMKVHVAVY